MNLRKALVLVLGLALLFAVTTLWALERGEVVILATTGLSGDPGSVRHSRVWIVDAGDEQWLEANNPASPWYLDVLKHPQLRIERRGEVEDYVAVPMPDPETRKYVRRLMREKYGLADRWVALLAGNPDSVAVRLKRLGPVPPTSTIPPR